MLPRWPRPPSPTALGRGLPGSGQELTARVLSWSRRPTAEPGASSARTREPPRPRAQRGRDCRRNLGGAETEGLAAAGTTQRRGSGPGAAGTCARSRRCGAPRLGSGGGGMGSSEGGHLGGPGPIGTKAEGRPRRQVSAQSSAESRGAAFVPRHSRAFRARVGPGDRNPRAGRSRAAAWSAAGR